MQCLISIGVFAYPTTYKCGVYCLLIDHSLNQGPKIASFASSGSESSTVCLSLKVQPGREVSKGPAHEPSFGDTEEELALNPDLHLVLTNLTQFTVN